LGRSAFTPTPKHKARVQDLARKGLNEAEIAKSLKIAYSTFCKYKRYFLVAIKKGREEGDEINIPLVENALLKSARGFKFVETKEEYAVANSITGEPFLKPILLNRTKTTKFIPPNPASTIFYLTNRKKDRWTNPMKIEPVKGDEDKKIPMVSHIPKIEKPTNEPPIN
jgi:hypothetical protein